MRKFSSLQHMPLFCSPQCTIKSSIGAEVVDGMVNGLEDSVMVVVCNSERCLKWGGWVH